MVCHLAYRGVTLESRCKMDSSGGILGPEIAFLVQKYVFLVAESYFLVVIFLRIPRIPRIHRILRLSLIHI